MWVPVHALWATTAFAFLLLLVSFEPLPLVLSSLQFLTLSVLYTLLTSLAKVFQSLSYAQAPSFSSSRHSFVQVYHLQQTFASTSPWTLPPFFAPPFASLPSIFSDTLEPQATLVSTSPSYQYHLVLSSLQAPQTLAGTAHFLDSPHIPSLPFSVPLHLSASKIFLPSQLQLMLFSIWFHLHALVIAEHISEPYHFRIPQAL